MGHLKSKSPVNQTEEFVYHLRVSGGLTAFDMARFTFQTHHSTSNLEMTWKELRLETERPLREPLHWSKRQVVNMDRKKDGIKSGNYWDVLYYFNDEISPLLAYIHQRMDSVKLRRLDRNVSLRNRSFNL